MGKNYFGSNSGRCSNKRGGKERKKNKSNTPLSLLFRSEAKRKDSMLLCLLPMW